jgi:hypothetical protein
MAFTEPVYLVPSAVVHSHARPISGNRVEFQFVANLSPRSRDKWATYQLSIAEVGPAILRVIEAFPSALQSSASISSLRDMPGLVWVGQLPKNRAA